VYQDDFSGLYKLNSGELNNKLDYELVYKFLAVRSREIRGVNKKGYVNKTDLKSLDVLYQLAGKYVKSSAVDLNDLSSGGVISVSKWVHNLMNLNIYCLIMELLDKLTVEGLIDQEAYSDLKEDLKVLSQEVKQSLEPTIREKFRKRGISLVENVYSGFDTEYEYREGIKNDLLSIQLAVNTRSMLKMPFNDDWDYSQLNVGVNKGYDVKVFDGDKIDYERMSNEINGLIKKIRYFTFYGVDQSIKVIIWGLIKSGVQYVKKGGNITFIFDRTLIKTYFEKVVGKEAELKYLVSKSKEMALPTLEKENERIIGLMKEIFDKSKGDLGDDWDSLLNEVFKTNSIDISNSIDLSNSVEESIKDSKDSKGDDSKGDEKLFDEETLANMLKVEELKCGELVVEEDRGISKSKRYTRTRMSSFSSDAVSVSKIRNNYLIAHFNVADLSMLSDFEEFKEGLDIVNKVFLTLKKPLRIEGFDVYIRDSSLLVPGGKKGLEVLGDLYPGFEKGKISQDEKENMKRFLEEDEERFKKYAVKDALIPLVHASFMEDFNIRIGNPTIPITLSSLGGNYVRDKWRLLGYEGYQLSSEYLLGETSKSITPKGLLSLRDIGVYLNLFISNYKGGRNESFMYGVDEETKWFDYDLTSAYTTVMCLLGHPDYKKGRILRDKEFKLLNDMELLYSYTIIKGKFKFPDTVKYPSIPCFLDELTTIYPLEGECSLTGSEYLTAKKQGCEIDVELVYYIPFSKTGGDDSLSQKRWTKKDMDYKLYGHTSSLRFTSLPFKGIISELQSLRRKHPKKSLMNLLFKEVGNSIYGLIVRGINNKMKYDIKLKSTVRMGSSDLSNPILASWITAFIRSILGELLHKISEKGGKVVSVTTDGFITDLPNLEELLLKDLDKGEFSLLKEYKKIRSILTDGRDSMALEVKSSGVGILSWKTRGQFSLGANIKAATGLQTKGMNNDLLNELLLKTFNTEDKTLEYIQWSLRSAKEIYLKGGNVVESNRDQRFRLLYDNRRKIDDGGVDLDLTKEMRLLDSSPVLNRKEAEVLRHISKLPTLVNYQHNSGVGGLSSYKSFLELGVRNFLKYLLSDQLNLDHKAFKNYKEIVKFLNGFNEYNDVLGKSRLSVKENYVATIKRRGFKNTTKKVVKRTVETLKFVEYVKNKFPNFDDSKFFR
jgi:hypothetical protein